ncbi:MAG: V-type ATPase subunit [Gemmatimonadota bacterium]|nr:V-type ATPase subunit [Gemmatimonadota bacterium]
MTTWDDLNARARGLAAHLLGRATLEGLAHAPDLPTIAAELASRGYPVQESARTSGAALELAVRRAIALKLRILARWAGSRTEPLAVLFEDEDRRSITALVRGAAQHAPAELRLSGLIPTPELPERALEELARQRTPASVASLLTAWRHPLAPAVLRDASHPEPDLFQVEIALSRAFAQRALAAARRAGRRGLLFRYVRQVIDIENAFTALALSEEKEPRVAEVWLPGGRAIALDLAQRAALSGDATAACQLLAAGFAGTTLAGVFAAPDKQPAGLELGVLAAQITELRARARIEPLSVAFLLGFALRLRAEALDIRRVIWGVSLGAPVPMLVEGLVTAA